MLCLADAQESSTLNWCDPGHGTTLVVLSGHLCTLQTMLHTKSACTQRLSFQLAGQLFSSQTMNSSSLFAGRNHWISASHCVHHPASQCSGCGHAAARRRGLLSLDESSWFDCHGMPTGRCPLSWHWWSLSESVLVLACFFVASYSLFSCLGCTSVGCVWSWHGSGLVWLGTGDFPQCCYLDMRAKRTMTSPLFTILLWLLPLDFFF